MNSKSKAYIEDSDEEAGEIDTADNNAQDGQTPTAPAEQDAAEEEEEQEGKEQDVGDEEDVPGIRSETATVTASGANTGAPASPAAGEMEVDN